MIKKSFLLIFLFSIFLSAQTKKKDLYITYNDSSLLKVFKTESENIITENYMLSFNVKDKPEYKLSVTESGYISKIIIIVGSPKGSLTFLYANENSKNNPIAVYKKDLANSYNNISCQEIIYSVDSDFISILDKFNNIYLVDMTDENQNYYLAKKISVKRNPGL
jgi:hypothetical protein